MVNCSSHHYKCQNYSGEGPQLLQTSSPALINRVPDPLLLPKPLITLENFT